MAEPGAPTTWARLPALIPILRATLRGVDGFCSGDGEEVLVTAGSRNLGEGDQQYPLGLTLAAQGGVRDRFADA